MKKSKSYTIQSTESSKVSEPMMSYKASLLSVLIGMSYHDISDKYLPGQSLIDIQDQTCLSAQDIAGIVGVSKSKYYELVQLDRLGSKHLDALADFAMLWQKGLDAFDEDTALLNEWLTLRNTNLGNIKPLELLTTRTGRRTLEGAFQRIEYSTYG